MKKQKAPVKKVMKKAVFDVANPKCDFNIIVRRWRPVLKKLTEIPKDKWKLTAIMLEHEFTSYKGNCGLHNGIGRFMDTINEIRKHVAKLSKEQFKVL